MIEGGPSEVVKVYETDEMVNEHLNGASAPINSINLETLANSGSESEVNLGLQ